MIVISCTDDRGGMMFNRRRQSRDRAVTADIAEMVKDAPLWMEEYSKGLFEGAGCTMEVSDRFLEETPAGGYAFTERILPGPYIERVEKLVIYRWNRKYPADLHMDIDTGREPWRLAESSEFQGTSHDRITKEVYTR